jgi:25S rRNA (cytosine2278-C5)-methyltransferase
LAVVLVHDLFLAKKGVALPESHGLHQAVTRHKVRLSAELTKARLRRGCATLDALKALIDQQSHGEGGDGRRHPRWIRVNSLRTTLERELVETFGEYARVETLAEVTVPGGGKKPIYVDENIPNLLAIPAHVDVTSSKAYKSGKLILQDKASCFPAYLLDPGADDGTAIDACAAPGNKTTHIAAILKEKDAAENGVIACEKDALRAQTLQKMVKLAGGEEIITIKAKQDFLRLDPSAKEFEAVTALLLDPSCSGSGIVGRDEGGIVVHLPTVEPAAAAAKGKKRKRSQATSNENGEKPAKIQKQDTAAADAEETPDNEEGDAEKLRQRLANLSAFQLRIIQHAMAFPAARRITYSTCSVYAEENEHVGIKALASEIARERGWRVLRREEQVEGMRKWKRRGWKVACEDLIADGAGGDLDAEEVEEACIRCEKGTEEGTMGFFVVGFVRDWDGDGGLEKEGDGARNGEANGRSEDEDEDDKESGNDEEEEWNGFDD